MMKKLVIVGTVVLFICAGIPSFALSPGKIPGSAARGDILYVGGSGPGNYSTIQDAINASTDGDTVYVYAGVYHESINISKAITLQGESPTTTLIEAVDGDLILISGHDVEISGFTLQPNATEGNWSRLIYTHYPYSPMYNLTITGNVFNANESDAINLLFPTNCLIKNNIFAIARGLGIYIYWGINCTATGNIFTCKTSANGIVFSESSHINITDNLIQNYYLGIWLDSCTHNIISNNTILKTTNSIGVRSCAETEISDNLVDIQVAHGYGIILDYNTFDTTVTLNHIRNCTIGLYLENTDFTNITKNTFERNTVHARFFNDNGASLWDQNYWGRPRILPKPILGIKDNQRPYPGFLEFDRHPAQKPYDIAPTK